MSMPYCYLIGWTDKKKYYYGVRWKKGCDPKELMISYKTSSKVVHKMLEEFGQPDLIQIRKIFKTKEHAIRHENVVLRRMKVTRREDFLNQTDNRCIILSSEARERATGKLKHTYSSMTSDERKNMWDRKWTEGRKQKKSQELIGKKWWTDGTTSLKSFERPGEEWQEGRVINFTEEGLKNLSISGKRQKGKKTGKIQSKESNEKRSKSLTGRIMPEDTRQKISCKNKGKRRTNEQKERIKEKMKHLDFSGENNPGYGSKHMSKRKHFNDGEISIMAYECPPGFQPGRKKFKRRTNQELANSTA